MRDIRKHRKLYLNVEYTLDIHIAYMLFFTMKWTVEILNKKVQKELESLPKDLMAKFLHIAQMLEDFGPENIKEPFVKPLKFQSSSLWEIRMKGKSGIARAIYVTVKHKRIVILHAFVKKSQKTPQDSLIKAVKRIKEINYD